MPSRGGRLARQYLLNVIADGETKTSTALFDLPCRRSEPPAASREVSAGRPENPFLCLFLKRARPTRGISSNILYDTVQDIKGS